MNSKLKGTAREFLGWYGAVILLAAYALSSFNILDPGDTLYQILNGTGAFGIAYISFKRRAYQPAVLNVIWFLIALISLIRSYYSPKYLPM